MSAQLLTPSPQVKQFSPGKIIMLHLIPGVFVAAIYALIVSGIAGLGYPKVLALGIASIFVLVPTQLGYILYFSKKNHGTYSIKNVIPYKEKISIKDYAIYIPLLFIWSGLVFTITKSLGPLLLEGLFYWLPDWYLLNDNLETFSKGALTATFLSCLFLTGVIAPTVEELYFRGFLLPRMSCFGKLAPLVNAVLFAVYHFWTPWVIITRALAMLPMAYVVQQKRNIYIGIIVHCLLNILGDAIAILALILSM